MLGLSARRLPRARRDVQPRGPARLAGRRGAASRCRCRRSTTRCWPCRSGAVERALVPIENSLEGSVNATLDALAFEADDVVDRRRARPPGPPLPDRARAARARAIRTRASRTRRPAGSARASSRTRLPRGARSSPRRLDRRRRPRSSPRATPAGRGAAAASATALAAELYGCEVLARRASRTPPATRPASSGSRRARRAGARRRRRGAGRPSLVFWGAGSVRARAGSSRCLSEFAVRAAST